MAVWRRAAALLAVIPVLALAEGPAAPDAAAQATPAQEPAGQGTTSQGAATDGAEAQDVATPAQGGSNRDASATTPGAQATPSQDAAAQDPAAQGAATPDASATTPAAQAAPSQGAPAQDPAAQGTTPPGAATPGDSATIPAAQDGAAQDTAALDGGIPQLQFVRPANWVKVEVIDNVTGGCFLQAEEAQAYATEQIRDLELETTGDDTVFHVIFRIRTTGQRTPRGECFGAIFFEELYPVDVAVQPGAEPYRSRWQGRLGLQKLVITDDAFDRDVFGVVDDAIRMLFRER